tara:strand:- start:248 stop:472 length:225 start_codon:yes stop_codon:yes gene_type:complete
MGAKMKFTKTANFKSIQKFFHVYLPVAILLYAILWIGAMMYDDLHETLHDPIFIIAGLIFAIVVIMLYWQPKRR